MAYDPEKHHRRSIRLVGFDYTKPGAYFITMCTQNRLCVYGAISNGRMHPNAAGEMIESVWRELPVRMAVGLDAFVLMPNHVHGIVWIDHGGEPCVRPDSGGEPHGRRGEPCVRPDLERRPHGTESGSLPRIVQAFKSISTNAYIKGVKEAGWPRFDGHLWQRNYFEHVIRDEESLSAIREYIETNPLRWAEDVENAGGTGRDDPERWLEELIASRGEGAACDGEGEHEVRPYGGQRKGEHEVRRYGRMD